MATILGRLIEEKARAENRSLRSVARELGISHSTINRAVRGEPLGVDILTQIANWLGVNPASVINAEGVGKDALAAQIALVLETEPRLAEVFGEAMDRVLKGRMDIQEFRDLANYAAFRLHIQKEGETVDGTREERS